MICLLTVSSYLPHAESSFFFKKFFFFFCRSLESHVPLALASHATTSLLSSKKTKIISGQKTMQLDVFSFPPVNPVPDE